MDRIPEAGREAASGVVFEEAETIFTKDVRQRLHPRSHDGRTAQYDAPNGATVH